MKGGTSTPSTCGTDTDTEVDTEPADVLGALEAELAAIDKAITAAQDRLAFIADPAALAVAVCALSPLQAKFEALCTELYASADRAGVHRQQGLRTIGQYVGSMTNTASADANAAVSLSRWLREFPLLAQGFAAGEIGMRHLNYMRTKLDTRYDNHIELKGDQEFFVDTARDTTWAGFKKACDYWLCAIDPDGKEPQDQLDENGLKIRRGPGGRRKFIIDVDAINGHALQTMIDHEADKLRTQRRDNLDDAAPAPTQAQRRLAALFGLATRGFERNDGTHPVPLINIVMSLTVAEWARNQLLEPTTEPTTGRVPVDPHDPDGRCELIDGTPVHPLLVAAVTGLFQLDAPTLRRYVFDADSRLLDVSVNARSFPEWMRTAHIVQSRGQCDTPGCDAPTHWLHIDHIHPRSKGGPTSFWNGQPQCGPDNQAKSDTTGHTPWRDRPPPTPPPHRTNTTNTDDPDH